MSKKVRTAIDFDQDGNLTLGGGDYGGNYRVFSNDEALNRSKLIHQQTVQRRAIEDAQRKKAQQEERARALQKAKEDEARRIAQQKVQEKAQLASQNVAVAKLNKITEADKKRKQAEQETVWYKALGATAANLTTKVPGLFDVLSFQAGITKGVVQHSGIGKIGQLDLTDIRHDRKTGVKTIDDGKGGRRKITEKEYQDILHRDQTQYGKDQEDLSYNIGAVAGTILNTGLNVAGSLAPAVLGTAGDIFGGVSNLVRDSMAGSKTAGTDFITKLKMAETNLEAGVAGADVALSTGMDKVFDNDYTEKRLAGHKKNFDRVTEEGTDLQREYLDSRGEYVARDVKEDTELNPFSRAAELESWEAGITEEPAWHKKKEGVFDGALEYYAKNPGRIFDSLAGVTEDILQQGLSDKNEANSDMIRGYQAYNDIKAKNLFGKEMKEKDIQDFQKNSQEITMLDQQGRTVSVPKNRIDPKILEEDSKAVPDYLNIQEVETDEEGRAVIDPATGHVKYRSKYNGMFGLEKVGKAIDFGSLTDAQYVTQTLGSTVGSVLGFIAGGGVVAKGIGGVSAFSKSSRALNTMRNTYGAEALQAAGVYGKAASKLAKGAKVEDISKNLLLNYVNSDSEIRTNAEATKAEIHDELVDRAADINSEERTAKRDAILAEQGITKENPLYQMHVQNMLREERARYLQLNPDMALNISTKAEIGGELAAQAGRMQMLTSINETAAFFTRSKLLSRAGVGMNPVLKSMRTKALEAGFEGAEETIGDYSDKYAKAAILDNTFHSVADYAREDFLTKEGLETFALGALMGVGQNSLAGAKKLGLGESDNISERIQEYKEQKQALKNIQTLKSANSFDDVLKIYDQLSQQTEVVERNSKIKEAIDRGDTDTAHSLKQEAFAQHSLRMAKLGLTGEVERNLQHLLKTPGLEAEPEVIQDITRAIAVNKEIADVYDIHSPLINGDDLSSNRVSKTLNQEKIEKLRANLEAGDPMYREALESYSRTKGVNFADDSEEGKKLQEQVRKEFNEDEGSVGGVVSAIHKNIEKLEKGIEELDKSYYHAISKDYQRQLRNEKQAKVVKAVKKATTQKEVNDIIESLPEGEAASPALRKTLLDKAIKFSTEAKAKTPGAFKKLFSKKNKVVTDSSGIPLQTIEDRNTEPQLTDTGDPTDTDEDLITFGDSTGDSTGDGVVTGGDEVVATGGVQGSLFTDEELVPSAEEIQRHEKDLLENEKFPEEFKDGSDITRVSEEELTDEEAVNLHNNTLDGVQGELDFSSPEIDVSEQKDPIIDQAKATVDQKLAEKKAEIVQKAAKNSKKNGVSPKLAGDLGSAATGLLKTTGKRTKVVKKIDTRMNPDDLFNIQDDINEKQAQIIKLFESFRKQFKAKNNKNATYKDMIETIIANSGYDTAESVNGFFGQTWIDSSENPDKAREEVREAYDALFGLSQTVDQLSNLANELSGLLGSEGEGMDKSTEAPRSTVTAQVSKVDPEPEIEGDPQVQEETEVQEEEEEESEEEAPVPTGTKPVLNPQKGLDEVVGVTSTGIPLVSLDEESSGLSPQFHFSSQEYVIAGQREDGTEILKDKYPNTNTLNRGDNDDRGGHMSIDNILNPALAKTGAKLKIVPYTPGNGLPDYDKLPFLEFNSDGVRDPLTKSFQDFLDKHNLDPVKYSTPALGPESAEEQAKRKLFTENVPMYVTVEHNGTYHQMGTILPSVNYINSRNTFPKGDSPQEKTQQARNIEIKRNNIYKQRQLILSGHSEFEVTDRVTRKFNTYKLAPGGKTTTEGDKMLLSKAHPTQALVAVVDKILEGSDKKITINMSTGKKLGRKISLGESHKDIVLDKTSVENFLKDNPGKDMSGWSVALIYKNTIVDAEGNTKKVYGITQTVNNSNQELQEKAQKTSIEMLRLKSYYRLKEMIRRDRVTPEDLEGYLREKVAQKEISQSNIQDYRRITASPGLTENADKIITKLSSNFGVNFMGLSLVPGGDIMVNSSTSKIMEGYPKKWGGGLTVSYSLDRKGGKMPMIDIQAGTVDDYVSEYTGRTGYDAFYEDSVGNPNMGFQINDVTTGKDITVFSPQPIINFKPVNIQESSPAPAPGASTSSIIEKKLAEKRRIEAEKAKAQAEGAPGLPPTVPAELTLEEELENIIASEVKYFDENGEEC